MTLTKLNMGKANLEVFSETLIELGKKDRDILVVTSDSEVQENWFLMVNNFPNKLWK